MKPLLTYRDYLQFLDDKGLDRTTEVRQVRPATCEFICHLFAVADFPNVLEIGRSAGHSYGLFRFLSPASFVVSIDPVLNPVAEQVHGLFDNSRYGKHLIVGTSDFLLDCNHEDAADRYSFVLIDGDHSYAAAKRDWDNLIDSGCLAAGAVVLFDNLNHGAGCGKVFYELDPTQYQKTMPCGYPGFKENGGTGPFGVVWLE